MLAKFEGFRRISFVILDITMPEDGYLTCSGFAHCHAGNGSILILTGLDDGTHRPGLPARRHRFHQSRSMPRFCAITSATCPHQQRPARIDPERIPTGTGATYRLHRQLGLESQDEPFAMSNELCRLVGVRPQDFTGTFEAFTRASGRSSDGHGALQQLVAQHTPCDIDHRIVLPNGTDFVIHLQAEAAREEEK